MVKSLSCTLCGKKTGSKADVSMPEKLDEECMWNDL